LYFDTPGVGSFIEVSLHHHHHHHHLFIVKNAEKHNLLRGEELYRIFVLFSFKPVAALGLGVRGSASRPPPFPVFAPAPPEFLLAYIFTN